MRRGFSEKAARRLETEQAVQREQLMRRVKCLSQEVILGSREFINRWFEKHRRGGRRGEGREANDRGEEDRKGMAETLQFCDVKRCGKHLSGNCRELMSTAAWRMRTMVTASLDVRSKMANRWTRHERRPS